MLNVYLNYPNSLVTVHGDATCGAIQQMRKPRQRHIRIDAASCAKELGRFQGEHQFASRAEHNDMWVCLDLDSAEEQIRIVQKIHRALSQRYVRFRSAQVTRHC